MGEREEECPKGVDYCELRCFYTMRVISGRGTCTFRLNIQAACAKPEQVLPQPGAGGRAVGVAAELRGELPGLRHSIPD